MSKHVEAATRAQEAWVAGRKLEALGILGDARASKDGAMGPWDDPQIMALEGMVKASLNPLDRTATDQVERAFAWARADNRDTLPAFGPILANTAAWVAAQERPEHAYTLAKQALGVCPDHPAILTQLALRAEELRDGRRDEAPALLIRALGLQPGLAEAHLGLAQHLLARGEYEAGWREYEWRNRTAAALKTPWPTFTSMAWNGMRMPEGDLFVAADQGFGDTFMFSRWLPAAARRCRQVVLGVDPAMLSLFDDARIKRRLGICRVVDAWKDVPPHAAHVRLTSLPHLLGQGADWGPSGYLRPDGLGDRDGGVPLRIGVAWRGRPDHPNDLRRSMLPENMMAGLDMLCLPSDTRVFSLCPGAVHFQSVDFPDWLATARFLSTLHCVVTVDTGVAHLAGALDVPTFILTPYAPEWRWVSPGGCATSLWYPSVRVFLPQEPGDWASAFESLANDKHFKMLKGKFYG